MVARTLTLVVQVQLPLGVNTYIYFSDLILWTLCEKPMSGREETLFCCLFVLWGCFKYWWVKFGGVDKKCHLGPAEIASYCCWFLCKLVQQNLGARGRYLTIQPSLATAWLLATRASPIHRIDKFVPLLPLLLKEMGMQGESKVLSFCI